MERFDSFPAVEYTTEIGDTPAAVSHQTGVLYINPDVFNSYPRHWQEFILWHELGHLVLQTRNELAADEFAFKHYVRNGGSLRESVLSLSEILDVNNNKAHYIRAREQLQRAQLWDEKINGVADGGKISKEQAMCNTKAHKDKHVKMLVACIEMGDKNGAREQVSELLMHADPSERKELMSQFNGIINAMDENDDNDLGTSFLTGYASSDNYLTPFLGLGKKAQARRDQKAAAKAELIKAKAEAKKARSQAKLELAKQGIKGESAGDFVKSLGGAVKTAAGAILGGRGGDTTEDVVTDNGAPTPDDTDTDKDKKNNTMLYVAIGVVILIIAIVVAVLMLRKKKKS